MGGVDGYTKLLLHFNGTNGSTTFIDEMGHAVSGTGNAQLDTSRKVFGTASLKLDGVGDWISVADSIDWAFGTEDFTIDFWITFASLSVEYYSAGFFRQYVAAVAQVFFGWVPGATNKLLFWASTGSPATNQASYEVAWTPSLLTPYHLAVVRSGSNLFFFINGVKQTLTVNTAIGTNSLPDVAAVLDIGRYNDTGGSGSCQVWIDEFRVSKGIARWTKNFTPPDAEYSVPVAYSKNFAESVGIVDALRRGRSKNFSEVISASEGLKKATGRQVQDALAMNETLRRGAGRRFSEGITVGEDYGRRLNLQRTVEDQVGLVEVGAKEVSFFFEETVSVIDTFRRQATKTFTEQFSVKDTFAAAFRWLKDTLNPKTWSKSTRPASTWQKDARNNKTWER